jgi:hypothetical protein
MTSKRENEGGVFSVGFTLAGACSTYLVVPQQFSHNGFSMDDAFVERALGEPAPMLVP